MSALAAEPVLADLTPELRALVLRLASAVGSDDIKKKAYLGTQLGETAFKPYLSWKQNEDGAAVATLDSYERKLSALALYAEEQNLTLDKLTVEHLRDCRDAFTPGQRRLFTAVIRDCFRWLYEEGRTPQNIAGRLRYPKKIKPVVTGLFTLDEKFEIVTAQDDIMDRVGVLLLLRAGLRQGELRGMQAKDVNLAEKYILVRRGKGSKSRRIPVKGELLNALNTLSFLRAPDEYLLCPTLGGRSKTRVPSRPMSKRGAHEWWYRCLARAEIVDEGVMSGRKMHTTRHTYATDLGRATGWNMLAVQKNLGHANIGTTIDIYTEFSFEDQADAVAMLPEIGA